MTNYTFKGGRKKGRNRYVGSWNEPTSMAITLPFTIESMKTALTWGAAPDTSPFTHQDIAHWCDRFHRAMFDIDTDNALSVATGIAADVEVQWDLYLVNTYSLKELQTLAFAAVRVPIDWFDDWLRKLEAAQPAVQADGPASGGPAA